MVDFSRLIRQAEEAKARPPLPKRGGERKPRRKVAAPETRPPAPPAHVEEPAVAEELPTTSRTRVPPPEAILEALIPVDAVAAPFPIELPVEEPPTPRPPSPPPPEAVAEAQIPADPPPSTPAVESVEEIPSLGATRPTPPEAVAEAAIPPNPVEATVEHLARLAQDEPEETEESAIVPPVTIEDASRLAQDEPDGEIEAAAVERLPDVGEPVADAPVEPTTASEPPSEPESRVEKAPAEPIATRDPFPPEREVVPAPPAPVDVATSEAAAPIQEPTAPVDDGLTPLQRSLISEVRTLLESIAPPLPAVSLVAEKAREESVGVATAVEEPPVESPLVDEAPPPGPDLTPEQVRLIAEVKAILAEIGPPPGREEASPEAVPPHDQRIEDVPTTLPGTEPIEIPVEMAAAAPPSDLPEVRELGEILGVVRDEAERTMTELDERARLAEELSPSPAEPEVPAETEPPVGASSPEALAEALVPSSDTSVPTEASSPPKEVPPVEEAPPPPREDLPPFPPPVLELPPPEEARPRRRRSFDLFADIRCQGKDLLDIGILLVGLAWLAAGLSTGDTLSWLVALTFIAVPTVDLYRRSRPRRRSEATGDSAA